MIEKTVLATLLEKHYQKTITSEEKDKLHGLLREIYSPGEKMVLYKCPDCKKPLFYMHDKGPACMYGKGGCGYRP